MGLNTIIYLYTPHLQQWLSNEGHPVRALMEYFTMPTGIFVYQSEGEMEWME